MKFNLNVSLKNYKGEAIKEKDVEIKVKDLFINCCLAAQKEERQSGDEMRKLYKLVQKIDSDSDVELTVEDLGKLKQKSEVFGVLLHGALESFLETQGQNPPKPVE